MDVTTVCIIGAVVILIVVYFAFRNKSDAQKMLEANVNVMPLMMQKATQIKITRLQEATQDDTVANEKLVKLVAAYKNNQINMQEYNEKLDAMVARLEVDL